MKLKTTLVAVTLAFATSSAFAATATTKTTLEFDSNNITFSAIGKTSAAFDDFFAFTLPDVSDIDANFIVGKTKGVANAKITSFTLSGPSLGGPIVLGGAVPVAFQKSSDEFFSAASAAGLYILEVKGSYLTAKGGSYTGNVSFTEAVPEPDSYAMILAGLGLIGFMSKRRNRLA